jgi:hypothetical protein
MKKTLATMMLLALTMVVGCSGGGGTSSGDDATFGSVGDLPRATSPMTSSATASIASKSVLKAALVGLNLGSASEADFTQDSSRGACEMTNIVKENIGSAAQADMILCYVATMNDSFDNLTDADGDLVDVYDGQYHIFNLNISDDDYAPDRIKMKIVKDSGDSITSFEMFMCANSPDGPVQNEYTSQTIDGTAFTMRAVGNHTDQEGTGSHAVDVVGTLNESGEFVEKEISIANLGTWGGDQGGSYGVLTQTPGSFLFSGYRYGSYTDPQNGPGTYEDAIYGAGELLNDTSTNIQTLAMGDGAVHFSSSGTSGEEEWLDQDSDAWDGDTTLPVDTNEFLDTAINGDLPTVEELSISFTSSDTWDCADDVGVGIVDLPEASQEAMNESCSAYVFDHEWVHCWEVVPFQPD